MAGGIQKIFRGMQSFTPLTKINKLMGKITVGEKNFIKGILLTGKVISGEKLLSVLLLWTATTLKKKWCQDKLTKGFCQRSP